MADAEKLFIGCFFGVISLLLKGAGVYVLYWWLLAPIFNLTYNLTYWESLLIGFLIGLIF